MEAIGMTDNSENKTSEEKTNDYTIVAQDGSMTYMLFDNGLRAVHLNIPRARVGYCGAAILAGSRDEDCSQGENGLAHFVEHTIFKGTTRRSSYHIINRMEAVGGELNAFTTKQDTVVYTAFPSGNLSRGIELVADLICNSRFPSDELDKERQVIMDEINSYLDSPADAVYDDFEDIVFAGSSLSHNILGSEDSLQKLKSENCRKWLQRFYRPERMVIFYAGKTGIERFARLVKRHFIFTNISDNSILNTTSAEIGLPAKHHVRKVEGNHQAHVVIGKVLPRLNDSQRIAMALFTNILGGSGMNSLLNVDLRERRGLVYNVEASLSVFSDSSLFSIYFACDEVDREKCQELVLERIAKLASEGLNERALGAAKKQYLGQMILAGENLENRIISTARATLLRGRALSDDELRKHIDKLSNDDIRWAASQLLDPSSLAFVP